MVYPHDYTGRENETRWKERKLNSSWDILMTKWYFALLELLNLIHSRRKSSPSLLVLQKLFHFCLFSFMSYSQPQGLMSGTWSSWHKNLFPIEWIWISSIICWHIIAFFYAFIIDWCRWKVVLSSLFWTIHTNKLIVKDIINVVFF